MIATYFNEFAALLMLTTVIGLLAVKLRQPLILAFIIAGIAAGPYCFNIIVRKDEIDMLASFGITVLLFIVGLKLDIDAIKAFGKVVLLIGLGQMILTTGLGFLLAYILGMPVLPAFIVASATAFSSTIIIIKALSDREEVDSLFGRITIGILIVQDLVVVLAIIILSSLNIDAGTSNDLALGITMLLLKGIGFLSLIMLLMRGVLPAITEQFAVTRELMILFALTWAVLLAAAADTLGFGKEIGGFLAGVSLASTHYRESIASRLDTVRNLLLIFFFINLGAALQFDSLSNDIPAAIILSLFVLLMKPLIVMGLMGYARFRKHTSFMTAITMGQVSEFSLILAALAQSLGYISNNVVGLIIFMSIITIALSTYMINSSSSIYNSISKLFDIFERNIHLREDAVNKSHINKVDVIVYGFGRHGEYLSNLLETKGLKTMAVDFDPRKVKPHHHHAMPIRYGDAEDAEFVKTLPLDEVQWVVSTIPHYETNQMLVSALREVGFKGKIAMSAFHENEIEPAKKLHVDLVFVPYQDAAASAAEQIFQAL
ncbi:MAG TPA: cation:proton antiporter [Gammaproteobacteria bacterium]|jgi:Kef-type K+ transport system membrane component KefB|nr:cation:proton antiporter [Gammaproteobacteria bacterium]